MVSWYNIALTPRLLISFLAVTDNRHEPVEGSTGLHRSDQHISSPVYEDADFEDKFLVFLRSNPVQHGSHKGADGVRDSKVVCTDEPRSSNQPGFGQHGSKGQPIELDNFEDELDDALEFTDSLPAQESYQPVRISSNVAANHRGTLPVISNVGMSFPNASGHSNLNQQLLQPSGHSYGPVFPPQTQSSAATRPSDAELAKHHADKKENKAKENAFRDQGRWWHRTNANVAAGIEAPSFDGEMKTNKLIVPAIQHSEIADQLRTTANTRGSYRESFLLY